MDSSQILVSGFPEGTTDTQLMIYFQSERDSGGGDVEDIEIDRGRAFVTFEDAKVAARVFGRGNHRFEKCALEVSLLPKQASSNPRKEKDTSSQGNDSGGSGPNEAGRWNNPDDSSNTQSENRQLYHNNRGNSAERYGSPYVINGKAPVGDAGESSRSPQCTVEVSGLPPGASEDLVINYFENVKKSKGGPVSFVDMQPDLQKCWVTFKSPDDAISTVNHSPHKLSGASLQVSLYEEIENPEDDEVNMEDDSFPDEDGITIIVSGISPTITEDAVTNYFENSRRSGGGEVSHIEQNDDGETFITFLEVKDLERLLQQPHKLDGKNITVLRQPPKKKLPLEPDEEKMMEEDSTPDDDGITIIVSGISPSTTEDAVINYFENARRSGGGDVSNIEQNDDGETIITFLEVKDLERLLQRPHTIDGKTITVARQPPKKNLPLDPVRIHVQGLCETTTEDCLRFYLEKFSDVEVQEVIFGSNNNALAIFENEIDFESLFRKVNKDRKGLEGKKPRLERVPVCSCILVTGLKKGTTDDTIELYFENEKRSGGKDVSKVERKGKDEALIYFEDPSSVHSVMRKGQAKGHSLEGNKLVVKPHYPFLESTAKRKMEIAFDPDVFDYIQMNHEGELKPLLEEYKVLVEVTGDTHNPIVTISSSEDKRDSEQSWKERAESMERFLNVFKKSQISIASEIFDEIAQRWQKQSSVQGPANFLLSFDEHRRIARIVGKKTQVDQEEQKLEALINKVSEDVELMKSVVQVVETNIPKPRLILLEMSGLCASLRSKNQHLSISVDSEGQKLSLNGPRKLLHDVKLDIFTFISKIVEQTTELPTKVINVLKRPPITRFVHDLFKQKSIQAVLLYDQGQSSNEVQVVGLDSRNAKEADNVLQAAIDEKSYHLTDESTQVLRSRKWNDFQSSLTSRLKVGITVDNHASTLWVSGIAGDVKECFDEVKTFLETNTIIHTVVPVEEGSAQFISTVWKDKLDGIKRELANCSVDMRVTADYDGIEVSGTAEGLEKCLQQVHDLIGAIKKDFVPVDKPGMKKFFLDEKGRNVLKTVEDKNKCVILTTERTEGATAIEEATETTAEVWAPAAEFICSYPTKERKTISVMKGDITKDRVDVIVNAANEDLRHIGGLAAAIVRAGGRTIQDECDAITNENGRLLEGHTVVTSAGTLPCKQVIHAVGPKWDSSADKKKASGEVTKQERYLKQAITRSLEEAKSMRSIAIPAVSSGVFGFPRDLCSQVILDAVLEFSKENPHCNLSEIHLINNDDPTVTVFADELRRRFAQERSFTDHKNSRPQSSVAGTTNQPSRRSVKIMGNQRSFTTQGIRITVKSGDLAKEKADILVGTAASNLNLTQNPCARALRQAAGPSLQQECDNIGIVPAGDIAVNNNPGFLRCKAVIFAICSEWDKGKGKKVLKRLLTKCLQEATDRGMASIAFPAIGTGTLQFPRVEVAEIFFDGVVSFSQKNPATTLKEVRFVLYDQDQPTVQAFEAEMQKRKDQNFSLPITKSAPSTGRRHLKARDSHASSPQVAGFSPVREQTPDHLKTNVGTLCFQVQPGDITKETTDAIVFISNPSLDMRRGGGAGAAILRAGGNSIQQECSLQGRQRTGSVVVTGAGNLGARFIFHIVPSDPLNVTTIKASVLKCLQEAERKKISSISFPAIGTGNIGIPAKSCAEAMLSAIKDFSDKQPTSMQLIKMIIYQTEMIGDVRLALKEASGEGSTEKPGFFQRVASKFGGFLGFGDSERDVQSQVTPINDDKQDIDFVIFAGCKEDLQGALKEINKIMKEKSTKKDIEHDAIANFSKEHFRRVHTLEQRYGVKISVEKAVARIVVSGQGDDVLNVMAEIHKILHQLQEEEHERKRAEALSKDIQWMYSDGTDFVPFNSQVNAIIEAAYDDKKATVTIISDDEEDYKIDFKKLTLQDVRGNVINVKRVDLRKGVEVPNHWSPQPKDSQGIEKTVHLVQLNTSTDLQEYQDVSRRFQQTCGNNNIVKIERVQNPVLFGTYAIRKQKMDEGKGSNEKLLFHGTPGHNCQLINHTGFNRSFHGKNATVYGNGVYFASDASYSARSTYSPPDANGSRYMYLTRVLVGDYTVGRQGLLTPPAKNPNDPTDTFDSVVDQMQNPGIFVVFYDWQCYPEYLITFQ